jgi:RHS repeat-associated protein
MNYCFQRFKTPLFVFALLMSVLPMFGQAVNSAIKDVVMPSPNAASLGKYGDIPVSYYSGVPSICIPIHTVQQGSISLPISLSYHAGGVKVGEPASWVGLGWSLSAGGMISRTVQGKADERGNTGYMSIGHKLRLDGTANNCFVPANIGGINYNPQAVDGGLSSGQFDGEPDIFSFSIGGYSGKFYIDAKNVAAGETKGKVVLVPQQDVRVEYDVLTDNNGNLTGVEQCLYKFILTTPNGVKYEFGDIGDGSPALEVSRPNNAVSERYVSGWHLKRVTAPDALNVINLNYTAETYRYAYRTSFGGSNGNNNVPNSANGAYAQNLVDLVSAYRLQTITTSLNGVTGSETVSFIEGDERTDVQAFNSTTPRARRLSAIQIQNGTYCKKFTLNQSYFEDNSVHKSGQDTDFRLKLNSVQESKCNGDSTIAPHIFTYNGLVGNENFLPNRLSSATDHWGYYNGATDNPKQGINIPYTRLKYYDPVFNKNFDVTEGQSNRETDEESMKLGTIRQVQYPTGGTTTFDYEANSYWDTEGVKKLIDDEAVSRTGICYNYTDPIPHRLSGATGLTKTFGSIDDMFYELTYNGGRPVPSAPGSCAEGPNATIFVFVGNSTTPLACSPSFNSSNYTPVSFSKGKLLELFPCLQNGVEYFFAIRARNMSVTLNFKKQVVDQPAINRKIGGLRIKSIVSNDGVSAANNVTKTYKYVSGGVGGPNMSSGQLYNKPVYGYTSASRPNNPCNNMPNSPNISTTHFWVETSIVPLGGFEGNHVGYSMVQEYYNAAATGYYTNYQYYIESAEPLVDLPLTPLQPRIGSGELMVKTHWDNSNLVEVAKEINTVKADNYQTGFGDFFKSNTYSKGSGSTPISFTKLYRIRNRPYRLSKVESWSDGIKSETNYTYDSQNRFYAPTEVSTTNSDGKVVTTKTYYAHNLPSNHPNQAVVGGSQLTTRDMLIYRFMIGIPLQTEQFVNGVQVGGSILEYKLSGNLSSPNSAYQTGFAYPFKAYSLNKDLTTKLNITVDNYVNGLPQSMTKAGYTLAQTYAWDTYGRLTGKTFGNLTSTIAYDGNSNMVRQIIDENGLRTKYYYDGLMRLKTIESRMKDDGSDVQAAINYRYEYKGGNNLTNFIQTKTTFKGGTSDLIAEQYMDGLGRPMGMMKKDHGTTGIHQKSSVTYDALGRQDRVYQPFASNTEGYQAATNAVPYVKATYELSPLSRPIRQLTEDNTTIESRYGANTRAAGTPDAADPDLTKDNVRLFVTGTPTYSSTGEPTPSVSTTDFYAENELSKTSTWNENGTTTKPANVDLANYYVGRTDVFKDKLGRVVLTRKFIKNTSGVFVRVDTYNVYDDYGSLVMVIPPDAISGNTIDNALTFQYFYDNQNRLSEKKIPGAAYQRFFYDAKDLLTLTQDGNMRNPQFGGATDKFLATEYDNMGRVKRTGWVFTNAPLSTALNPTVSDANRLTSTYYYPNRTWVQHQEAKVLKADNVATPREFVWSYVERRSNLNYTGNPMWTGKQHLLSKTFRYGDEQIDEDGPIDDNDYGGVDWSASAYDGLQKPTGTWRNLFSGEGYYGSQNVRTQMGFTYDKAQRLTDVKFGYGYGGAGVSNYGVLSRSEYNFKDQLTRKNLAEASNGNFLQNIDYQYNVRGWLTNINSVSVNSGQVAIMTPNMLGGGAIQELAIVPFIGQALSNKINEVRNATFTPLVTDVNADLFSENIYYNGTDSRFQAAPQYNGNIQATAWQVAGRNAQGYGYTYDELDRLTDAKYFDLTNSGNGPSSVTNFSNDFKFNEKLTYDLRGNIMSLNRNGFKLPAFTSNEYAAGDYGQIDRLDYTYNAQNQVVKITDQTDDISKTKGFKFSDSKQDEDYTYDDNGNLISDANKGIVNITYNYLNLPQRIEFTESRIIEFVYDAGGAKLRKIVSNLGATTGLEGEQPINTYDYVNGVEYKNTVLQRVAHTEGSVSRQGDGSMTHEYTLRDHLGNTRVTFSDANNDGVVNPSDIKQINHYYAFGLNMEGNWNGAQGNNKYGYNDKEWNDDFGLGWNDYGARYYDPAMARWVAVDPLTEKMSRHSAYNYCFNNPLKFVDPNGCEPDAWESMKNIEAQAATVASVKAAVNAFIRGGGDVAVNGNNVSSSAKSGDSDERLTQPDPLQYSNSTTASQVSNKLQEVAKYESRYSSNGAFQLDAYFQGFPRRQTNFNDTDVDGQARTVSIDGSNPRASVDLTSIVTSDASNNTLGPVLVTGTRGTAGAGIQTGGVNATPLTTTVSSGRVAIFTITENKRFNTVNNQISAFPVSYLAGQMRCTVNQGFQIRECWDVRNQLGTRSTVPNGWRYSGTSCTYPVLCP